MLPTFPTFPAAPPSDFRHASRPRWAACLVLAAALAVGVAGTRDRAGSWNDSSRLAMVESLVDHHTFAIDRSIYVAASLANVPADNGLIQTGDKLFIHGHYYSDKTPVPGLLLAVIYQGWQWCTGQTAWSEPAGFVWWVGVCSSGTAYVVAVWCIFCLGSVLGLGLRERLLLTGSFALSTLAPIYARQVNNHVFLLAVGATLVLGLAHLARALAAGQKPMLLLLGLGLLVGLGYATDQGAGPVLLVCALGLIAYRCRSSGMLVPVLVGAAPCVIVHHACNYAVGGTVGPANAVPEYFAWPGCTFDAQHMTGVCNHATLADFLAYAGQLLVGKRGFLGHNLPLFLALPALVLLRRRRPAELPEMLFGFAWFAATFLLYTLESTNSGGDCQSVRWLVPLLAPGYQLLAVMLRDLPGYRRPFVILSAWGMLLTAINWRWGIWHAGLGWYYWPIQGMALLSWLAMRRRPRPGLEEPRAVSAQSHPARNRVFRSAQQVANALKGFLQATWPS